MNFKKFHTSRVFIKKIIFLYLFEELSLRQSLIFTTNATIVNKCNRRIFRIYKGNVFKSFVVDKFIIGRRFSEFNFVKKPFTYVQKKKQLKQNFLRR